ncbi:hypothetical protein A9Q99_21515 [Gammaproteobacteria bacterium 45_16_T64]|nr:hypothetical protein A9Q99_21515 [Gammaproteobacteria bacterium 45_16_T64]
MAIPDRDTIQKLWRIKKLIREEFDTSISISQKNLDVLLSSYQQKSRNPHLVELISDITSNSPSAPILATPISTPPYQTSKTQYRGQETKLEDIVPTAKPKKTKRTIIYRGRIVEQEEPI